MDVGLFVDVRNPPPWRRPDVQRYAETLDLIVEADRLGAATVWLSEHHFFDDGYLPQPLVLAAAIAARTRTVRIGTAVLLLPLHSPLQIAEQASVVDVISGGRLDLGVGAGYHPREFAAFGADLGTRYRTVEERLLLVRKELAATGAVMPKPAQPEIPMWGGFQGPRGARIAARNGMGLLSLMPRAVTVYRQELKRLHGTDASARVKGEVRVFLSRRPERCWAMLKEHIKWQRDSYNRYRVEGTSTPPAPKLTDADLATPTSDRAPLFQVLTPRDAAEFIVRHTKDSGAEEIFLWLDVAGAPTELVHEHLTLALTELAPALAAVRTS